MTPSESRKYNQILEASDGDADLATKLWIRWKCLTDLYFLASEVFNMKDARDGTTRRKRLDPKVHRTMCAELSAPGDKLLLYPRLHMKSTFVKFRIIQLILNDPMVRVGLWSRTTTLVRKELASIKSMLASGTLREIFPDIISDPGKDYVNWEKSTQDELTIMRDHSGYVPQENQVEVWGTESTVTGHHYDYHFYDDIIDDKSVRTNEQIEKTMSWWQNVQAIKEIGAEETMTGTRKHYADVYGSIIHEGHFDTVIVHQAIQAGKVFYAFFTMAHLDKLRKRMGEWTFSCEMMNDVTPKSQRLFVPPHPTYKELPPMKMKYYITVDPAISEKKWANRTGICVGAVPVEQPNRVYFVEAFGIKKNSNELATLIVDKITQYRPRRVGIEYGMQQALQYIIDLKLKAWEVKNGMVIRPEFVAIPTGKQAKVDKIDMTLGAFVREARALFRPDMQELFHQMEFFNRHSEKNDDDILDAAAMMIQTVENFSAAHWLHIEPVKGQPNLTWETIFGQAKKSDWDSLFA